MTIRSAFFTRFLSIVGLAGLVACGGNVGGPADYAIQGLTPVLEINSGGGAAGSFQADHDFTGGNAASTTAKINTSKVYRPAPQAVYQTERYGNFTYAIPGLIPGGAYAVRLHFAEIYWSQAGQRVFDVSINGQQVLTNFDIVAVAGGKDIAIAKRFFTTADGNGAITLTYTSVVDNAKASGIEVLLASSDAGTATFDAGSGSVDAGSGSSDAGSGPGSSDAGSGSGSPDAGSGGGGGGGSGTGCVFSGGQAAAFCDTFDAPSSTAGSTRSGDLNGVVWGVSHAGSNSNMTQGILYGWATAARNTCGVIEDVLPNHDTAICNGMLVEAVDDDEGQTEWAAYPRQPFDIAGRIGTVVFDVSADSEGPHAAWPAFVYTDQPVPGYSSASALFDTARNSFGFTIANVCTGSGSTGGSCFFANQPSQFTGVCTSIDSMFITSNYALQQVDFSADGCVLEPTTFGQLNHFEVQLSPTSVVVYGTDPGSKVLRQIAHASLTMPLTRGLIWMEDIHYNADKFNDQRVHTFAWDNVGFDGPVLSRDLGFDVMDNTEMTGTSADGLPTQNLGYFMPGDGSALTVTTLSVSGISSATGGLLVLSYWPWSQTGLSYSLNGNAWHTFDWPFGPNGPTFGSQVLGIPVSVSEVVPGPNTIQLKSQDPGGAAVANIDLILVGAGGIPSSPSP